MGNINNSRFYLVIVSTPGHKPTAIGRLANRVDADAMVRFLQRKVPNKTFYVVFEPHPQPQNT